ncbi:monocarboxylate transporter 9-like [Mytilus edulis]|uniref:monocarboxylate transporter 9-like n=1 Tax=Mytilus edulis TaxID=6550 RepID=UPI0039EFCB85
MPESRTEEEDTECDSDVPLPPDGGWGWVVTFSSFMISFLVDGVCFTFGLFLPYFLDHFGGSKGKTALLGSVMNGMYLSFGPISSAFVKKFGARKVAVFGSFMAAAGLFLCTFSTNLDLMIFLYGGIAGGGFGLAYLPAIIMVGYYFEKRRAFATGIAVCGSGIGGFVFAPLCVYLINEYSWQGALWVISGIVLNGVIFCCFYRPLPKRRRTIPKETCETNDKCANGHTDPLLQTIKLDLKVENPIYRCKSQEIKVGQNGDLGNNVCRLARSQDICGAQKLHVHHRHVDTLNPLARKDIFYSGSLHHIPEYTESKNECEYVKKMTIKDEEKTKESNACVQFLKSILLSFDFSLLKSPTFVVYGISCFLCMFGFFIPFNFLPDYAKEVGLSSGEQAMLISMIGIANTVARLAVGFISDRPWADCLLINNMALILAGGTTAFVPFYRIYGVLITYSILFGSGIAAFVSLRSIIMVELMGIEKLSSSFGLVVLCQGLSSFLGPPVTGSFADKSGDYSITFYMAGVSLALAGIICIPLRRISAWEKNKNKQKLAQEFVNQNGKSCEEKILLEQS